MPSSAVKSKKVRSGDSAFQAVNVILMLIAGFITLYPFWQLVVLSFNDAADAYQGGIYFWPREWTLRNYEIVFLDPAILQAALVSVARTVIGTVLSLSVTGMFAYALSKSRLVGRKFFTIVMVITMFFNGGLIPTYLLVRSLGLMRTIFAYLLPYPFLFNAFNAIIMVTFFRGFPQDLEDSAKMDGANDLTIFARLVVPTSKAVFAVIALFVGVAHWNSWLDALLYGGDELKTLQLFLVEVINATNVQDLAMEAFGSSQTQTITVESVKITTMVVTTVPIVLVYPFLQKFFVKGALLGSLKG
jgi:putative aldouronate transport system permease protein